jgi:hypothetical protein
MKEHLLFVLIVGIPIPIETFSLNFEDAYEF